MKNKKDGGRNANNFFFWLSKTFSENFLRAGYPSRVDVTKTGNGERGAGSGERGAGNGERKPGNELSAETSIKIQNGR